MKLKEAQELSPYKVAVWGNHAMKDVVWPSNSDVPYLWIGPGYSPLKKSLSAAKVEYYYLSDLWEPIDEPNWVMKYREQTIVPSEMQNPFRGIEAIVAKETPYWCSCDICTSAIASEVELPKGWITFEVNNTRKMVCPACLKLIQHVAPVEPNKLKAFLKRYLSWTKQTN